MPVASPDSSAMSHRSVLEHAAGAGRSREKQHHVEILQSRVGAVN